MDNFEVNTQMITKKKNSLNRSEVSVLIITNLT